MKRANRLRPDEFQEAALRARARARAIQQGIAGKSRPLPDLEGADPALQCPSSRADVPGARIFGVNGGGPWAGGDKGSGLGKKVVQYLELPVVPTAEVLELAAPASPGQVFRIAAPCAAGGCTHFNGSRCKLGGRIVAYLPEVVEALPFCPIRSTCRWYAERGKAVCLRCPQFVTLNTDPTPRQRLVAQDPAQPPWYWRSLLTILGLIRGARGTASGHSRPGALEYQRNH